VWSIRHDRSLTSSASSDRKMERAIERLRHRRSDSGSQVMTQAERLEFLATHNTIRNDITGSLGRSQPTPAGMMKMVSLYFIHSFIRAFLQRLFKSTTNQRRSLHRQLRLKDLPKVPTWLLERESNLRPVGRKAPNLPMSHNAPTMYCVVYRHLHRRRLKGARAPK